MEKLNKSAGQSMDIVAANIAKLKELFPEILTENKIDFKTLQALLGEEVETEDERYSFNWHGKAQARQLAQSPSAGTLRPCKEDSVDWDTTHNIFVEGDNLEALKLLQKSYHKRVKMIYIDPPYNTGNDFVYHDDFRDSLNNYKKITGQVDLENRPVINNPETSGRYHTDWLNMMYPRLKLARNLLTDDGVIFISIDDNEAHNLKKICDEIFGDGNVEQMIWNKEAEGSSGTLKQILRFRVTHETIIVCYKMKENQLFSRVSEPLVGREDELQTANLAVNEDSIKEGHPNWMEIDSPTGKKWFKHWKFNNDEINRLLEEDLIYWGRDGNNQPRLIIPTDHRRKVYATSIINKGGTTQGRKDFESIMEEGAFSYPKPISLISFLMQISNANDLILDFFSGSATTAHAILTLNAEDGGSRKFIMVQLPEICDETSDAFIAGYKTIADIGKERIRRAAKKIKDEYPTYQGDLGFKVFKLDSSNLKPWDVNFDSLANDLAEATEVVKAERRTEDVLYEILLKYGLDLTLPIETHTLEGKTVYEVGAGALVVCLDSGITEAVAEAIGRLKETLEPEVMRVVFKDSGFANDAAKVNAVQVLKQFGIDDVKSI
jgi:adenine-specific DNA-methyltransferase